MKFETARLAMVELQLRPNGVRDPSILNAFATLPRETFVPEQQKALAYRDEAVAVAAAGPGSPARFLLAPMVLARMLQFAAPSKADHALDIGGATGYSAAILSQLCGKVDALEGTEAMAAGMRHCLQKAGVGGVAVHAGPMNDGLAASKPFGLILVNGGVGAEPKVLFDQLADGGRLIAIIRKGWFGQAFLFSKYEGAVSGRAVFDAGAEILPGFEAKPEFVF